MTFIVIQSFIGGLVMGIAYAILASGYTVIWGAMNVINFAHAAFGVLAAYIAHYVLKLYGIDPLLSLILIAPGFFVLGIIFYELTIRPLASKAKDIFGASVVLTLGVSILLENLMLLSFSPTPRFIATTYSLKRFLVFGITIPVSYLIIMALGIISIGGLYLFLFSTYTGKGIRAVWQNREGAILSGVNPYFVTRIGYGIALSLAGTGGVAMALINSFHPSTQISWMILVWIMATFGGIGSIQGAILGAVLISEILSIGSIFVPRAIVTVAIYVIIIATLLIRPQGLWSAKAGS